MELKIDSEFKKLIPPLTEEEYQQLEQNIIKDGWRPNEYIILWNGIIVDGHNRYEISRKYNIEFNTKEKEFSSRDEVMLWIIENQLGRRNITPFARVELELRKKDILKAKAKEKQKMEGRLLGGNPTLRQKSAEGSMNTREEIAKKSKVSHDTVSKVEFIKANADEETISKVRAGVESINRIFTDLKKKNKREEIVKEFKEVPFPEGKKEYSIIYVDPAWKYFEGGNKNQSLHYKSMTIEEIKNLPVSDLAKEDSVLFMWVTFPILKESFEVIEAWGFKYATCGFVWVKKSKAGNTWHFGLGNWTRSNAELCLIATKGKPMRFSASVSQIIDTPVEEHSKKPDIVRDKIVELCGDLPRIELFARQKIDGWDSWGNEVVEEEIQ